MSHRRQTTFFPLGSALVLAAVAIGCGPDFDPGSLIEKTRVLGARVEVDGAPERAAPLPGETATVTWLVTAPTAIPPLGWAFALCAPNALGKLSCDEAPLELYQGMQSPPRVTIAVPGADVLGSAQSLILYGRICVSSAPTFDPGTGYPGCTDQGDGTTAAVSIKLQDPDYPNHNPVADHGFTFDGQAWTAGSDPCSVGLRVKAGTEEHVIAIVSDGADRESYTAIAGYPPVPTALREALQISEFTTLGKLKTGISFVEAAEAAPQTTVEVKWTTPKPAEVTAERAVTFTFVVRDDRGGTDWTTRAVCVTP
jgi:hypothetical protein